MVDFLVEPFLFYPQRGGSDAPAPALDVWLPSGPARLHAWHAHVNPDAPTLLWSHGNAGNITSRRPVFEALVHRGLNVLAYDYRGYGRSNGRPTVRGLTVDVGAAWNHLVSLGVPAGRIVLFGESLGGAVSVALAAHKPCAGLALLSTFSSLQDAARTHFGPLGWFAGNALPSATTLSRLTIPLWLAHGNQDEVIPVSHAHALHKACAAKDKTITIVGGGTHNDVLGRTVVLDGVAAFARRVTGPGT